MSNVTKKDDDRELYRWGAVGPTGHYSMRRQIFSNIALLVAVWGIPPEAGYVIHAATNGYGPITAISSQFAAVGKAAVSIGRAVKSAVSLPYNLSYDHKDEIKNAAKIGFHRTVSFAKATAQTMADNAADNITYDWRVLNNALVFTVPGNTWRPDPYYKHTGKDRFPNKNG